MKELDDFSKDSVICADLVISTMTVTCQLKTEIEIINVGKYIHLSLNGIVTVRNGKDIIRSIITHKKKRKMKKQKKSFYNQITLEIYSKFKKKKKPINIKIFRNGSLQMTGCVCSEDCKFALQILCEEFKKIRGIYSIQQKKIIPIKFVKNIELLDPMNVSNIKIVMINSNFKIGFEINRMELYRIFILDRIECSYEPCVHACVNIKYNCDNAIISIFVFESGAIIITGAKNKNHIVSAYCFITTQIYKNYNSIVKTTSADIITISRIFSCIEDMKKIFSSNN